MNSIIRKLTNEEMPLFADIAINAYPGVTQNTPEFKEKFTKNLIQIQESEETIDFFGLFRDGKLLGGMRIHYFKMNLFSKIIDAGGIGQVAVDLLHKKEKVAKELVGYFIAYFKEKGVSLVMLYPFRPDFYKKMGFGYGTKMNQYHAELASFPNEVSREGLVFLDASHKDEIRDCYNQYAESVHGMIIKTGYDMDVMFKNPDHKLVGFFENGKLKGYLLFAFKKMSERNFLTTNIVIKEMIYESPESLLKLCAFLHSQQDQIQRVTLQTQDDSLEYLLGDPRNGSNNIIPSVYHEILSAGVGIMYRIINAEKFFSQMEGFDFNSQTATFKLTIEDSFMLKGQQTFTVKLVNGQLRLSDSETADFEAELNVADLSSLLIGAADVQKLYNYGKLKISSKDHAHTLHKIFINHEKPICMSAF
ncbi:GNAT family N-acetyltransferase [Bacillus sp. M6-12]|uniref:GNAT family N-acetyltransferase n=1 Tax=Bacillus sp. M6-12 TaxID=2054166 RepID=UPI0015E1406F|nr:GNAT family N-acetyltransferase [Bacillus sp. M6-12]